MNTENKLREALAMAVRQNEHDMLMTGEELRTCRAALSADAEPVAEVPSFVEEVRKVAQATLAAGPGVAVKIPDSIRAEFMKFMRDEPSELDKIPYGEFKALPAAFGEATVKCRHCGFMRTHIDADSTGWYPLSAEEDAVLKRALLRSTKPVTPSSPRAAALCMCKDRPADKCPGEWEPGCDLGNNPKFVRVHVPGAAEAGEASYVHTVPDHCDRIVWRGQYVHLPRPEARESVPKAEAGEAVAMVWHEGPPPFPQDQEWFIAETTYGDRVVLRSLDEGRQHKGNYDFKTADGTYLKAELVKRWMQFPDCEYLPPAKAEATARRAWALMLVAAPQSGADIPTATIKHENGETEVGLLGRMAGAQPAEARAAASLAKVSTEAQKLLPCPFCGGQASAYPDGAEEGHSYRCWNTACEMSMFGHATDEEARRSWNTRALASSQEERKLARDVIEPILPSLRRHQDARRRPERLRAPDGEYAASSEPRL